jgi:hypothetical protein
VLRLVAIASSMTAFLCAGAAFAERGAVSVEVGSGVSLINVRAPYALGAPSQMGSSFTTSVGVRYALMNFFEVGASAFYQPSTTFTHAGAQVPSPGGVLEGALLERTSQIGALIGARFVHGFTWRFVVGGDFGLARRSFSGINHYDVSDPSGAQSYGLSLSDTWRRTTIVAPSAGLQWTGDHVAVGFIPRVEFLLGRSRTWALTMPLTLSWSWY